MSAFPGMCRVNHAEVMRFKGRFDEAEELAGQAGEQLRTWCPRIAGAAFYELGETRLRLGELAQAEQAFREADEHGHNARAGPLAPPPRARRRPGRVDARSGASLGDETIGPRRAHDASSRPGVDIAVAAEDLEGAEGLRGRARHGCRVASRPRRSRPPPPTRTGRSRLRREMPTAPRSAFRNARTLWEATGRELRRRRAPGSSAA